MNTKHIQAGCVAFLMMLAGLGHWLASDAQAYPEPELVTRAWELEFSFEKPRIISAKNLEGRVQWFWYMPYKVVNNTGQERMFIPDIEIASDTGDIRPAGRGVPSSVFDVVKAKLNNPLLESPVQVIGRILLGEEHARESVIIWPANDQAVDEVNIFFAGLSGETQVIKNPQTGEDVVMRKTLMIELSLPGNPAHVRDQAITPRSETWIIR